jgi:hypothetical protein
MKSKFDLGYFKKDIKENPLNYLMMLFSLLGGFLTSDYLSFYRGLGFLIWLVSNFYIFYIFYKQENLPMAFVYIVFEFINIRGLLNNWWF